jgi:enoyl-CoA hydratase/carnithine racemase
MAKLAGRVNTMHYVLTSDFIHAPKAKELGLVSEVFKKEELHEKVIGIAN